MWSLVFSLHFFKSPIFSMSCMELIFFKELIFNDLLGSSNFEIVFIKFFMPLIEFASSKIGKALFFIFIVSSDLILSRFFR